LSLEVVQKRILVENKPCVQLGDKFYKSFASVAESKFDENLLTQSGSKLPFRVNLPEICSLCETSSID